MAGWIRMRVELPRDPRVIAMARKLSEHAAFLEAHGPIDLAVARSVVVSGLLSCWGMANDRGKIVEGDAVLDHAGLWVLDEIAGFPGFGDAMAAVDWAREVDGSLVLPSFSEFNVPARERPQTGAERQRRYRARRREAERQAAEGEDLDTIRVEANGRDAERNGERNARCAGDVTNALLRSEQTRAEEKSGALYPVNQPQGNVTSGARAAPTARKPSVAIDRPPPRERHVSEVVGALVDQKKNGKDADGRPAVTYAEILAARALQKMRVEARDAAIVLKVAREIEAGTLPEMVLWDAVEGVIHKKPPPRGVEENKLGYFARIVERHRKALTA